MNCPACRRENPSDAAFCAGCGVALARICSGCGRSNAPLYCLPELEIARGDFEAAARTARRLLELAQRLGSQFDAVANRLVASLAELGRERWQEAWDLIEPALALAQSKQIALDAVSL